MTPRQRVITALHKGKTDKVPFTVYENKIPQCTIERELRNRGLCIVKRVASYKRHTPNVQVKSFHSTTNQGHQVVKTIYTTPFGDLTTESEDVGYTSWRHEWMYKTPDDYKAILFLIQDTVVEPNYDEVAKTVTDLGEDFVVRDGFPLEPLQNLISAHYMKTEDFCIEWMDRRDEILKLYDAFVNLARKIYPVVADGPLEFVNYGGNVTPQIIGVENFKKYYVLHYNEAAEILHKKGKLIGCHLDADNTLIMDAVATTYLDYIEAYDPSMSPFVKDARRVWPNKVLWINWPSAYHLKSPEEIQKITIDLIEEVKPLEGFIIGITEDMPKDRWRQNFVAIMDGIDSVTC